MKGSVIVTIVGTILLPLWPLPAHAIPPTRTWVSGVGDDMNPCTRTQPCQTFATALPLTAAGGEINCLDAGGFGSVTINKAIKIKCGQTGVGGVIVSGTNAIAIAAGPNDVIYLEGLDINGTGFGTTGISFISGKALHVSNCVISDFTGIGISFTPSTAAASLVVQDSKVVDNTAGGILVAPTGGASANATITNTHMDRNQFGLKVKDGGIAAVFNSTAASNTNNGFVVATTSLIALLNVSHSLSNVNGIYNVLASGPGAQVTLFNVSMYDSGSYGIFSTAGGLVATTTPATNFNTSPGTPTAGFPLE